jgi:ATP/maltotriose-dependent transcriptional regulator MalT
MNSLKLAHAHNRLQRNDLLHLLDRSQAFALTLILAPAGSGKSTLLHQWRLQNSQLPMAHVGLNRRDQDPIVFLRHYIKPYNNTSISYPYSHLMPSMPPLNKPKFWHNR